MEKTKKKRTKIVFEQLFRIHALILKSCWHTYVSRCQMHVFSFIAPVRQTPLFTHVQPITGKGGFSMLFVCDMCVTCMDFDTSS